MFWFAKHKMTAKKIISLLVLLVLFSETFGASCENKVRLSNLQDIIKNQTKLIQNMEQVIENQKNLIENQARSIQNQTLLHEGLRTTVEHLKMAVYFTVSFTGPHEFLDGEIIKFDRIITNSGDGYVVSDGKFIAPVNGTYHFSGIFYDRNHKIGVQLMKNAGQIIFANNGVSGTGSFNVIFDLVEGYEVYLERPYWVVSGAEYSLA